MHTKSMKTNKQQKIQMQNELGSNGRVSWGGWGVEDRELG